MSEVHDGMVDPKVALTADPVEECGALGVGLGQRSFDSDAARNARWVTPRTRRGLVDDPPLSPPLLIAATRAMPHVGHSTNEGKANLLTIGADTNRRNYVRKRRR